MVLPHPSFHTVKTGHSLEPSLIRVCTNRSIYVTFVLITGVGGGQAGRQNPKRNTKIILGALGHQETFLHMNHSHLVCMALS